MSNTRPDVLQIIKEAKDHIIGYKLFQMLKEKGMDKDIRNIKAYFNKPFVDPIQFIKIIGE